MNKQDLIIAMWAAGIIRFAREGGGFTWKLHAPDRFPLAPLAPLKIEFRSREGNSTDQNKIVATLTRQAGCLIAWDYHGNNHELFPRLLAGIPNVGRELAAGAAMCWPGPKPLQPRVISGLIKDPEGRIIPNPSATWPEGSEFGLIDDVLSRGDSVLEAKNALPERYQATQLAVLVEHPFDGRAILVSYGIRVHSVIQTWEILETLRGADLIDQSLVSRCERWFEEIRQLTSAVCP